MKRGPGYVIVVCLLLTLSHTVALAQSETREKLDASTVEDLESLFDLFGEEGYDDLSTVIPPADSGDAGKPAAKTTPPTTPMQSDLATDLDLDDLDPVPNPPAKSPNVLQPSSIQSPVPAAPTNDDLDNPFRDDEPSGTIAPFALPPAFSSPTANNTGNPPPPSPLGTSSEAVPGVPRFDLDFSPSASDFEVLEPTPATDSPIVESIADPVVSPPMVIDSTLNDGMELFEPSPSISESVIENLEVFSDSDAKAELPDFELDSTIRDLQRESDSYDEFVAPSESDSGILEPELGSQLEPVADPLTTDSPMYESDTIEALPFCVPELEMQTSPFANAASTNSQYPTSRLTGFFHADYSWFSQDTQFFGDDQDYRGFRRARLAAVGSVADNVDYMLEMDFGFPGRPHFMDVWMDVHGFRLGTLRVGQWRQPFGLGELNSVRDLVFHERASMFFLGPFRQTGVGLRNHDGRSTYAVSAFGSTTDPFGNSVGDSSYGMAARLTTLFFDNPDTGNLFHLGAGYSHVQPGESGLSLFVPQELFGPTRFSNIGPLLVLPNQTNLFNAEFAAVAGPWHAQAEVRYATSGGPGPDFFIPAAYAQIAYVLTGETRKYDRPTGSFRGGIDPFRPFGPNGRGAWEVALRFSHIDLNDSTLMAGRNNSLSIGLNWYLNRYAKFQFNYLNSKVSRNFVGPANQDVGSFALRAQVAF
ncbi:MAG: porin [Planctomycetota bacterium]